MDEYTAANLRRWNDLVGVHQKSDYYDLDGFKAGKLTLRPIEVDEIGGVSGKSLLHLQCHFGLDTLSWARLGARVTGVDFSGDAIDLARALAAELGIDATFICSDMYALPGAITHAGEFDIVFASYGVLCWLPDVFKWARVAAGFVKPGGCFYMVDDHPFACVLDSVPRTGEAPERLVAAYPYFHRPEPMRCESPGSYADRDAPVDHTVSYEWAHSLGDVINALIRAGLRIEFVHEFPYCAYQRFPAMKRGCDGWWRLEEPQDLRDGVPLLFSVRAVKAPR